MTNVNNNKYESLKLTIKMGADAFTDEPYAELTRILKQAITRIDNGEEQSYLFDSNGNKVGEWLLVDNWYYLTAEESDED